MKVYIINFDPTGKSAVGGFDWWPNEIDRNKQWDKDEPDRIKYPDYIYKKSEMIVPDGLTNDEITDFIDLYIEQIC